MKSNSTFLRGSSLWSSSLVHNNEKTSCGCRLHGYERWEPCSEAVRHPGTGRVREPDGPASSAESPSCCSRSSVRSLSFFNSSSSTVRKRRCHTFRVTAKTRKIIYNIPIVFSPSSHDAPSLASSNTASFSWTVSFFPSESSYLLFPPPGTPFLSIFRTLVACYSSGLCSENFPAGLCLAPSTCLPHPHPSTLVIPSSILFTPFVAFAIYAMMLLLVYLFILVTIPLDGQPPTVSALLTRDYSAWGTVFSTHRRFISITARVKELRPPRKLKSTGTFIPILRGRNKGLDSWRDLSNLTVIRKGSRAGAQGCLPQGFLHFPSHQPLPAGQRDGTQTTGATLPCTVWKSMVVQFYIWKMEEYCFLYVPCRM